MTTEEKVNVIRQNIIDGLSVPSHPIDDRYLISDLELRITGFDYMLEGMLSISDHSEISQKDISSLLIHWIMLMSNLKLALSLLEYVKGALNLENVDMIENDNATFPIDEVKRRIEEYQKERAKVHA